MIEPPCALIVDPDEVFSAALAAEAQAAGLRPICCRNWWEAKPVLEGTDAVAVMIVELVLPERTPNGLSAALMARSRREGLPVMFVSAQPELLREVPTGTGAVLSKNVGPSQVMRCAVQLMDSADDGPRRPIPQSFPSPRLSLNPVARYRLDRKTCFRSVSDSALVLWRKDRAEVLGRPLLEVFPQLQDQPKLRNHLEVLSGRAPYRGVIASVILKEPIDIRIAADPQGLRVAFSLAA